MPRPTRRLALAAVLGAMAFAGTAGAAPSSTVASLPNGGMALGDPKAAITVTEYASASCSHCAAFHNEIFPAFKAKYVDTGKVRYVLREILTPPADLAAAGFLIARCAPTEKYFAVIGEFFHAQPEIFATGLARPAMLSAGAIGGMDEVKVAACISDEAARAALDVRVEKNAKDGGVTGTPTFFVNKTKLGSVTSLADLDAAIAKARKK